MILKKCSIGKQYIFTADYKFNKIFKHAVVTASLIKIGIYVKAREAKHAELIKTT